VICRVRRGSGSRRIRRRTGVICPVGRPVGRTAGLAVGRGPRLPVRWTPRLPGLIGLAVRRRGTIPNGRIRRVIQGLRGRNVPGAAGLGDRTGRRRGHRRDVRRAHRSGRRAHRAILRCRLRWWRIQQRPRRCRAEDRRRAGTAEQDSYVTRLMGNALCPCDHQPTYSETDWREQI
jgi:hypothetical protein